EVEVEVEVEVESVSGLAIVIQKLALTGVYRGCDHTLLANGPGEKRGNLRHVIGEAILVRQWEG
ncbi:MAG: hypothetical protein WD354_03885, partial [Acidimicrobiia bacterium]